VNEVAHLFSFTERSEDNRQIIACQSVVQTNS